MLKDAEFCPECGAPMHSGAAANSSDSEVHAELAQANLHRMRGEHKQAEDLCLGILRRFPNNATANTLLGDIATARGDLDQAAEWYELALDIVPDSKEDREKLAAVKAQMADRQRTQSEQHVEVSSGIPTRRSPLPAVAAGVLLLMVAGAVGFSMFSPKGPAPKDEMQSALVLKDEPKSDPPKTDPVQKTDPVSEHEVLSNRIADAAQVDKARLTAFAVDIKDKSVRMGFSLGENDADNRASMARLIHAAFGQATDAPVVHLTADRDGKTVESFHPDRKKYDESQSEAWKTANGDSIEALVLLYLGAKTNTPAPTDGAGAPSNVPTDGGSPDPAIEPPPAGDGGETAPPKEADPPPTE